MLPLLTKRLVLAWECTAGHENNDETVKSKIQSIEYTTVFSIPDMLYDKCCELRTENVPSSEWTYFDITCGNLSNKNNNKNILKTETKTTKDEKGFRHHHMHYSFYKETRWV